MRVICIVLGAGVVALGLYFVFNGEMNADEGFYLLASKLVDEGFRPYADFGFTQTPLVPYANLPWLHLFGFELLGLRLAGLMWTMATVGLGIIVLRRSGWATVAVFLLLLVAAPGWMAFSAMGKTYAFAGFSIMLGAVALRSDWAIGIRWTLFLVAAAMGVAARLPTAAFFAVGGVGLLIETPGWKKRTIVMAVSGAMAGCTILLFATGAWEETWFWTADFHRHVATNNVLLTRLRGFAATGSGIWLATGIAAIVTFNDQRTQSRTLILALTISVVANLGRPTTYGEYVVPFIPMAGLIAAPWLADTMNALRPMGRAITVVGVAISAFLLLPRLGSTPLIDAADAAAALREFASPDGYVVASMPEIPVMAGFKTYPELALGKFALTEEVPPDLAARMHMVTPDDLVALLEDERTVALALSDSLAWNFLWSLPSMSWISRSANERISASILSHYTPVFENKSYQILVRQKAATTQPAVPSPALDATNGTLTDSAAASVADE